MSQATIMQGDCLERLRELPDSHVHTCVTSPPYFGLRDYGVDGQIGLEPTPDEFVAKLVEVFREVSRVLRDDGTLWLNLGDSYAGGNTGGKWREGSARADGDVREDGHSRRNRNGTGAVEGLKPKDLIGIPWRVAFALQADGWHLRQDIIWHKPNPMPESVRDRCTKAHEYIFLMSKSPKYYFDHGAMQEPCVKGAAGSEFHTGKTGEHQLGRASTKPRVGDGRKDLRSDVESRHRASIPGGQSLQETPNGMRNRRDVWTVATQPFKEAHFATFPPALVEPCVLAGAPADGIVLDPFNGSGTTGLVALRHQRNYIGCELNPNYAEMSCARIQAEAGLLHQVVLA